MYRTNHVYMIFSENAFGVFLNFINLKVTPITRVFGMLRCGFPFYVFTRQN